MQTPHDARPNDGEKSAPEQLPEELQRPPTFREFLTGKPAYRLAETPVKWWLAVLLTAGIMVAAQFLAIGIDVIPSLVEHVFAVPLAPALGEPKDITLRLEWTPSPGRLMRLTLLSQIIVIAAILLAARPWGLWATLRLGTPAGGWRLYAYAIAAMLPVLGLINGFSYLVAPKELFNDFNFFSDLARGSHIVTTALAIGAGAPLSEELLFRGFLLSALAATRIGFWPAAILATLAWTALHFTYSWVGMLEVFVIGLYFSWLLWRTGSLWPALFCHALYNSSLLAALRYWPT